jgi:hypothetical protein
MCVLPAHRECAVASLLSYDGIDLAKQEDSVPPVYLSYEYKSDGNTANLVPSMH